MVSNFAKNLQF